MNHNIAIMAGQIIGTLLPAIIGIVVSVILTKRREDFKVTAWPTVLGLIVTLITFSGGYYVSKRSSRITVDRKVIGPAQPFAYSISPDVLKQYAGETRDNVVKALRAQGETIDAAKVSAVSTQANFGGMPLAAIRTEVLVPDKLFMYEFLGPSGADMISLTCATQSGTRFEVNLLRPTEECGAAVMKNFEMARGEPVVIQPVKRR